MKIPLASIVVATLAACTTPQEQAARDAFYREAEAMTPKAAAGDRIAQRNLCSKYFYSKVGSQTTNSEEAMRWCLPSAREENGWSEYVVGWLLAHRFRQDYAYYPEYQSVTDHKGRYEFAIYWLRRAEKHGYVAAKKEADEAQAAYTKEWGTPKENWLGKIAVATAGAAIIGGSSNTVLSSTEKARMASGFVADVMTDGKGRNIQSAQQDIRSGRAASTANPGVALVAAKSSATSEPAQTNTASSAPKPTTAKRTPPVETVAAATTAASAPKLYPLRRNFTFPTLGDTEKETCAEATKQVDAHIARNADRRIVNRGACTCTREKMLVIGSTLVCRIPLTDEIMVAYDPNKPTATTSK